MTKSPDSADESTNAAIAAIEQKAASQCADSERVFRLVRIQPFRFNKYFRLHFNDHGCVGNFPSVAPQARRRVGTDSHAGIFPSQGTPAVDLVDRGRRPLGANHDWR